MPIMWRAHADGWMVMMVDLLYHTFTSSLYLPGGRMKASPFRVPYSWPCPVSMQTSSATTHFYLFMYKIYWQLHLR